MVEKTEDPQDKMTIVLFSGELDRALAAFMVATTGASMGMHVTMFFTFWGLNVIQKNDAPVSGKGIMRKMLNWMNRGGSKRLKLSKFHMLGLGTSMMGTLMRDVKIPSIEEFIKMAEDMGIEMIACTTSIGVMGLEENAFRAETSDLAGAAYFLGEARKSSVTLFI